MTKVIFLDGRELIAENILSRSMLYNGVSREYLTFTFPEDVTVATLIDHFTPANCKQLYLEDESGEQFLHENYTIRLGAGVQERGNLLQIGEDNDHRMVSFVKMIRTTKAEQDLDDVRDTVKTLLVANLAMEV